MNRGLLSGNKMYRLLVSTKNGLQYHISDYKMLIIIAGGQDYAKFNHEFPKTESKYAVLGKVIFESFRWSEAETKVEI